MILGYYLKLVVKYFYLPNTRSYPFTNNVIIKSTNKHLVNFAKFRQE